MDDLFVILVVAVAFGIYLFQRVIFSTSIEHHHLVHFLSSSQNFNTYKHSTKPWVDARLTNYNLAERAPHVHRALNQLVDHVLTDFIESWYSKISTDPEFPHQIRDMFNQLFNLLAVHCVNVDWTQFTVRTVIVNLNYLLRIYRITDQNLTATNVFYSSPSTPEVAKHKLLRAELLRTYHLHPAVTDPNAYLKRVSTALLSKVLRPTDFQCEALRCLLREILANNILYTTMQFVNPYWINYGVVNLLNKFMEEDGQKMEDDGTSTAETISSFPSFTSPSSSSIIMEPSPRISTADKTENNPTTSSSASNSPALSSLSHPSTPVMVLNGAPNGLYPDTIPTTPIVARSTSVTIPSNQRPASPSSILASVAVTDNASLINRPYPLLQAASLSSLSLPNSNSISNPSTPSNAGAWDVRILGATIKFDPKPYVTYTLAVKNTQQQWTVEKRYNQFEELHSRLKKRFPTYEAQLPKKHFFRNLDQAFIQNRKRELNIYLGQLLWNRSVQESEELQFFLSPTSRDKDKGRDKQIERDLPRKFDKFDDREDRERNSITSPVHAGNEFSAREHALNATDNGSSLSRSAHISTPVLGPTSAAGSFTPSSSHDQIHASGRSIQNSASMSKIDRSKTNDSEVANHEANHEYLTVPSHNSNHHSRDEHQSALPHSVESDTNSLLRSNSFEKSSGSRIPLVPQSLGNLTTLRPPSPMRSRTGPARFQKSQPTNREATGGLFGLGNSFERDMTDPLYQLLEELFDLNSRGWVRRQATWVGKQLVRLTANKVVHEWMITQMRQWLSPPQLASQIDWVTELIWPNGLMKSDDAPVTAAEKDAKADEAKIALTSSLPSSIKTLLGSAHCEAAMLKFFRFLQMEPLMQHFAYNVLDAMLFELFPDLQAAIGKH